MAKSRERLSTFYCVLLVFFCVFLRFYYILWRQFFPLRVKGSNSNLFSSISRSTRAGASFLISSQSQARRMKNRYVPAALMEKLTRPRNFRYPSFGQIELEFREYLTATPQKKIWPFSAARFRFQSSSSLPGKPRCCLKSTLSPTK